MAREYYLISKNLGRKFVKYKGNVTRISSQCPYTYDEIILGKYGNPEDIGIITTFRDSSGNILERCFDLIGKPIKNKVYTTRENTIGDDNIVKSTHIKQYSISREFLQLYQEFLSVCKDITPFYVPEKFETHHICTNINSGEKVHSHVIQTNLTKPTKQIHQFIEYPHIINGKIQKMQKKILEFMVNTLNYNIVKDSPKAVGVQIPQKDKYLAYRALDIEDAKIPLTLKYIKERKVDKMDITINPYYHPTDESGRKAVSLFNPLDGSINFRYNYIFRSKQRLAQAARHEVEHAWQFYLHARHTGGASIWQIKRFNQFGPLRTKKMKTEAQAYTDSINNYVSIEENLEEYRKNYIEIKASEAGSKSAFKYFKHQKEIRQFFPYIPSELL